MEASGAVLGRIPTGPAAILRRDGGDPALSGGVRRVRLPARPRGGGVGFSDEGHLKYYAPPPRCAARTKEDRRRSKLVEGLARDLSALSMMGLGIEAGEKAAGESEEKIILEAAEILLAQLKQLRAEEKEMKRKRKHEKSAMKAKACEDEDSSSSSSESSGSECTSVVEMSTLQAADPLAETKPEVLSTPVEVPVCNSARKEEKAARMKACEDEDSSSSSSSESSDSECETVVDMSSLRTEVAPAETKPKVQSTPIEAFVCNSASLPLQLKTEVVIDESQMALKPGQGSSTSRAASNCCKTSSVMLEKPVERIEVCMGGKCKKSGAMELLEEFERKVGIEGAVVGCRCMGKCRDGPNVRVLNHSTGEESSEAMKNPLCIGVGLEDVGNIVVNFFHEKKDVGLLAA